MPGNLNKAVSIARPGGNPQVRRTPEGRPSDAAMFVAGAPYAPGRAVCGRRCRGCCPGITRCER